MNFLSGTVESDDLTADIDFSSTQASFLHATSDSGGGELGINPYSVPSLGFHGVVAGGLTLGGGLGYASVTGERDLPDGTTQDNGTQSLFMVAPRIGYLISPSRIVSIWLRGGITHSSLSLEAEDVEANVKLTSVTIDPQLVVTPVPHAGILFGIALNPSVAGSEEATFDDGSLPPITFEGDLSVFNVGLTAGLALLF